MYKHSHKCTCNDTARWYRHSGSMANMNLIYVKTVYIFHSIMSKCTSFLSENVFWGRCRSIFILFWTIFPYEQSLMTHKGKDSTHFCVTVNFSENCVFLWKRVIFRVVQSHQKCLQSHKNCIQSLFTLHLPRCKKQHYKRIQFGYSRWV